MVAAGDGLPHWAWWVPGLAELCCLAWPAHVSAAPAPTGTLKSDGSCACPACPACPATDCAKDCPAAECPPAPECPAADCAKDCPAPTHSPCPTAEACPPAPQCPAVDCAVDCPAAAAQAAPAQADAASPLHAMMDPFMLQVECAGADGSYSTAKAAWRASFSPLPAACSGMEEAMDWAALCECATHPTFPPRSDAVAAGNLPSWVPQSSYMCPLCWKAAWEGSVSVGGAASGR